MQTINLKAPAKVNLHLDVLAKRRDGFHDIETIFEKIGLCDEISLSRQRQGIRVFCRHKDVPKDASNLGFRAAQALLAKTACAGGVRIKIVKRIPVACGLGGGSSDAASVLLGLNELLGLKQTRPQLLKIAKELGADVPFFILRERSAIGRGKGDKLTPLRVERENWYILVIPEFKVFTPMMYRALRIALTKVPRSVKIVLHALKTGNLTAFDKYSYNSFEPVLIKKYREISEIKKALKSCGVSAAKVSGSGPCVFGIARTRKEAMNISRKLRATGEAWQVIVTKTYQNH